MTILDTHAWLWLVADPKRLSARAQRELASAAALEVSSISCWELAEKSALGKIALDRPVDLWILQALSPAGVESIDLSPSVAIAAAQLRGEGLHGDPADRMIVATAVERGAKLISKDRALREFASRSKLLSVVW